MVPLRDFACIGISAQIFFVSDVSGTCLNLGLGLFDWVEFQGFRAPAC